MIAHGNKTAVSTDVSLYLEGLCKLPYSLVRKVAVLQNKPLKRTLALKESKFNKESNISKRTPFYYVDLYCCSRDITSIRIVSFAPRAVAIVHGPISHDATRKR